PRHPHSFPTRRSSDLRTATGKSHHVAVRTGISMKHALREQRQKCQDRKPEKRGDRCEDNEGDQAAVVAYVVQPAAQLVAHAVSLRRWDVLHMQRHQRAHDDEERHRIEEKGRVYRLWLAVSPFEKRTKGGREEQ